MPVRPFSRERQWLLPPTLDELLAADHAARFVGSFIDQLDAATWAALGVTLEGEAHGAPAYDARALLGVWTLGFMDGVRSTRALEAACREQIPYLWLSGAQCPDHNTLWRFYERHRLGVRALLKRTVRTAVAAGLVDLALQAVDGTRVQGNLAERRTLDAAGLARLLDRVDARLDELESQQTADDPSLPALPAPLRAEALRARVAAALAEVTAEDGPRQVNLTDPEARLLRTRHGYLTGYNAQAMASPLRDAAGEPRGQLITAADLTPSANDLRALLPMMEQAEENSGAAAAVTLADAGYHSGVNLAACAEQGRIVAIPDPQQDHALRGAYHKDQFAYDRAGDSYTCPAGQPLSFYGTKRDRAGRTVRRYRANAGVCAACPAFGLCTRDRKGRTIEVGPDDAILRAHRAWQATPEATALSSRRSALIEPVFSVIKDRLAARRFLLRGAANVRAEWIWLAVAFNLRALARAWRSGPPSAA